MKKRTCTPPRARPHHRYELTIGDLIDDPSTNTPGLTTGIAFSASLAEAMSMMREHGSGSLFMYVYLFPCLNPGGRPVAPLAPSLSSGLSRYGCRDARRGMAPRATPLARRRRVAERVADRHESSWRARVDETAMPSRRVSHARGRTATRRRQPRGMHREVKERSLLMSLSLSLFSLSSLSSLSSLLSLLSLFLLLASLLFLPPPGSSQVLAADGVHADEIVRRLHRARLRARDRGARETPEAFPTETAKMGARVCVRRRRNPVRRIGGGCGGGGGCGDSGGDDDDASPYLPQLRGGRA